MVNATPSRSTLESGVEPRAIFFDVGETLICPRRPYGELLAEVGRESAIDIPASLVTGLAARIRARVTERAEHMLPFTFPADASQRFWYETYHGYFRDYLSSSAAACLAQDFLDVLSTPAGYVLYDDAVAALESLHAAGYQLGIISNWEAWLPALLEEIGIARFFSHVLVSGEVGIEKPETGIFTLAMEAGGYRPEEVVYVGDSAAHDVIPAQKVGITPVLLDRANRYPDLSPAQCVASLEQLPMWVRNLRSSGA